MAFAYGYIEQENFLTVVFKGEIHYEEESVAVQKVFGEITFKPGLRILVDRRNSSFASTSQDVHTHIALVKKMISELGQVTVAIVVSADFDFGMLRMFETLSSGELKHRFRVTRDFEQACAFLAIDPNDFTIPTV